MNEPAIQDRLPGNLCWGCGADNSRGLGIKSHWRGEESWCEWQPEKHHSAGPPHVLNGGVIATVIDCHAVCTAIGAAYRAEGREVGSAPKIWYATASLKVDYHRPTPLDRPVLLKARVRRVEAKKTWVDCLLFSGEAHCATAEVLAVRVPSEWLEPKAAS